MGGDGIADRRRLASSFHFAHAKLRSHEIRDRPGDSHSSTRRDAVSSAIVIPATGTGIVYS